MSIERRIKKISLNILSENILLIELSPPEKLNNFSIGVKITNTVSKVI
tara:strand:+ start:578 stop:721 length:144 start_codon:yes stop_codon:yes gene_type:complete